MHRQISQPHGVARDEIAKPVLRLASEQGADTVTILDVRKAMGMNRATRQGEFPRALDAERAARRIVEMLQGMAVGWPFEAAAEDTLREAWERVEFIVRLSGSEDAPAASVVA